ncbi:MAG: efflux RND transporter permease subunit [Nitrospinae bacterium]|nr:efflux RND transporter permease subunit [Nitrospinota bacterium]
MNVPELFVRRPVMTVLVMFGILLYGMMSYRLLPVSALPNVDFPTIQVSAELPGASPETMASAVATPLEKQFSTIAGLDSMNSVSAEGSTQVTLQFSLDRDIDAAAQDVQSAISATQKQLPPTMTSPPSYRKVNPADLPIFYLALTSSTLPLWMVDEYAETAMAQRISMVSGVAQVLVYGAQKYAVRVQLDPDALATRGIGIDEVEKTLNEHNVNLPTGTLYGKDRAVTIQASGQLTEADAYKSMIVAYRNGSPVRLHELGKAVDSVQNNKVAAWHNDTRGIVLAIQRQPGTNTIGVVDAIKELLPGFARQIPAGLNVSTLYDRSESIRDSVNDVQFSLVLALTLVVLVIFVFLRNLSSTIIPSLALPFSIIGAFSFMYLMGYSINILSLMALTLSVGFVVDDAIVMLENITRHEESGETPMQATLKGAREISFTILSMTLSLVAVFFPVFFMSGILGRLLHEFSATIMAAVLISGFISLTLTPMLCSRFLRPQQAARHGSIYNISEKFFAGMKNAYDWSLQWVLRHRRFTMALFAGVVAATGYLFVHIPKGFLPNEDTGQLLCFTEAVQDISFDAMAEQQKKVADIIRKDPNVETIMSFIGAGGSSQTLNLGRIFVRLKPRGQRVGAEAVIQGLRPTLAGIPGIKAYIQNLPTIRIGGQLTKSPYQYTLQSGDTEELFRWAPALEAKIRSLPGFNSVTSDLQISKTQTMVEIDRDKAASLGVSPQQIENALYDAYGSRQVSTIYTQSNQYAVILELDEKYQADPSMLPLLYVNSSKGVLVPLNNLGRLTRGVGPLTITHLGQLPSVTISFDLEPGTSLGDAIGKIQAVVAEMRVPDTITASFQGSAQVFQSSLVGMGMLMIMAVLAIYIVLGILYESFIHPVTILSGLPTAGLGALITLMAFHMELNMYGFVGMIMLIGIVKKNAIMMIDFAIEAQKENKPPLEAIYSACLIRFRPIMMTTMAALMGAVPIALGLGAGGETRRPLGLTVVGGLLLSQFLTLYITPVIYLYLENAKRRFFGQRENLHALNDAGTGD